MMFEEIRKKALELFEQRKYTISKHANERFLERSIYLSDIKLILLHGSLYKKETDSYEDIRYTMRGWDKESRNIRVTFIIKRLLIIITVIREEEI
ncbi:MAG: DUF4258 domain-containing protein [Candidatus Methanoperedens sp.]|nr:DUF4258 domain-containing protein [Candidatus Methanoperedens sp.]